MKRSFSSRSFVTSLVAMLGLALFGLNAVAHAAPLSTTRIGAGSDYPAGFTSDGGSKMNIDKSVGGFPNLAAGIYDVTDFGYLAAHGTSDLQPFLAKLTGDVNVFEVLWIGPTIAAAGTNAITTVPYAAGTEQFTLAEATDVYAGYNGVDNPVRWARRSAAAGGPDGPTAHNDGDFSIVVGGDTPSFAGASPNINRTYAFEINVDQVAAIPEPSSLLLATIALAGLVCAFRRRRRRA